MAERKFLLVMSNNADLKNFLEKTYSTLLRYYLNYRTSLTAIQRTQDKTVDNCQKLRSPRFKRATIIFEHPVFVLRCDARQRKKYCRWLKKHRAERGRRIGASLLSEALRGKLSCKTRTGVTRYRVRVS